MRSPARPWRPLLEGAEAQLARGVIERALSRAEESVASPNLYGGHAGLALLHTYLARDWPESEHGEKAERHLEEAVAGLAAGPATPGLFGGVAGVGFALDQYQRLVLGGPEEDDPASGLDELLLSALSTPSWSGGWDLFDGLVGIGVYFLERLPRPSAVAALERVLLHLEAMALPTDVGLEWKLTEELAIECQATYSLGVAHGTPAAIALLGLSCRLPQLAGRARPIYESAVRWFRARGWRGDRKLPVELHAGYEPKGSRVAWCNGEPGVAAALLLGAEGVGSEEDRRMALDIGRAGAERPIERWQIWDLAFCHGVAGVAHSYNRLFQATGEPLFERTARQGLLALLRQLPLDQPVTDWKIWRQDGQYSAPLGLVEGTPGVALPLLAAISPLEPGWDRAFLLSAG